MISSSIMQQMRGRRKTNTGLTRKTGLTPLDLTKNIAFKYYESICTPVSLSLTLLLRYGEYKQLVEKNLNPLDYNDLESFRKDYLALKFLSKCAGLPTGIDTRHVALQNEAWCEAKCKQTNLRLLHTFPSFHVNRIRCIAQDLIQEILGDTPSFEELVTNLAYGPGASSSTTGTVDHGLIAKVSTFMHITSKAQMDLSYAVQIEPSLTRSSYDSLNQYGPLNGNPIIIETSNWGTVPKSAKTDRGICTSIHGLMPFQKALGSIMRDKFRSFGLDLNSLWKLNQDYAQKGSITSEYCTLDIKSASSTISYETVFDLLPRSWSLLLDRYREDTTDYGDGPFRNFKFSAMGNGYTFELESIIFFALARAVQLYEGYSKAFCSSFGDDVITLTSLTDLTTEVFTWFGFTINNSKSFSNGYFRESCGGDFWGGVNVTPLYLKSLITYETDLIKLANRIRHYLLRRYDYLHSDVFLIPCWQSIIQLLIECESSVSIGSIELGDTVIWANPEDAVGFAKPAFYAGLWYTRCLTERGNRRKDKRSDFSLTAWGLKKQQDMLMDISTRMSPQYSTGQNKYLSLVSGSLLTPTTLSRRLRGVNVGTAYAEIVVSEICKYPGRLSQL